MTAEVDAAKPPPADTIGRDDFYAANEDRRHSHVLSYGSGWQEPGWSDSSHVVEIMWFGKTHEIVAYFITYDWTRLSAGQINRDAAIAGAAEITFDSGQGIGRMLGDLDLATSDIHVRVLGAVHSDLACHELLWDWRWRQHHSDGLAEITARIAVHQST